MKPREEARAEIRKNGHPKKILISKNLPPNIPGEAQTGVNWYFNPLEICYANE
jgi:hypothetical protein